jgi:hypothetical protein
MKYPAVIILLLPMRPLSSTFTGFYKRVLPAVLGFLVLVSTVVGVVTAIRVGDPKIFFLPLLFATIWFLVWHYIIRPLADEVWLDESDLVVRKGGLQESIPLRDVETVEASYLTNPERITVKLREHGPFGNKIVFLPPTRYFRMPFTTHPLADELRDLVRQHTYPDLHR